MDRSSQGQLVAPSTLLSSTQILISSIFQSCRQVYSFHPPQPIVIANSQKLQSDIEIPKRVHRTGQHHCVQQCPPGETTENVQRTETEERTGNHPGTQRKQVTQTDREDNDTTSDPTLPIRSKTALSETEGTRPPNKSKLASRQFTAIPPHKFFSKMPFHHKPKTKVP